MGPSILVYTGAVAILIGAISLIRPLRFLRIRSRRAAAIVLASGLVLCIAGFAYPVAEKRALSPQSELDRLMPVWHFDEHHSTYVDAPAEHVFNAIRQVRANEILLFKTLTTIRRFGRTGPENILNAPETKPIIDVATSTTFARLFDQPPNELVVGTIVRAPPASALDINTADAFRMKLPPGYAIAAMNFKVEPAGPNRSFLWTETRVYATDQTARRAFSIYWRLIHPGSDIIRRMWLRAVRRRAELNRSP